MKKNVKIILVIALIIVIIYFLTKKTASIDLTTTSPAVPLVSNPQASSNPVTIVTRTGISTTPITIPAAKQ